MATKNVIMKRWSGSVWDEIYPKTTAENIISGTLNVARIPNLDASKITSGTFSTDRIPSLSASKITSDTFDPARIPGLDASKITSGTFNVARLPAIAITDVTVDTTMTHFLTLYSPDPSVMQKGDVLVLTTDNKTYIHNGGTSGTDTDFTLLSTPTAAVASVNGRTGLVTLTASDVNLGNVTNESKTTMFTSPTFTGTPLSTTASKGTNTTQIATTAFVQTAIGDYVPTTRTVNGKALSANISITASDVGLGSVVNATMDNTPISGSANYVKSGGVYTYVGGSLSAKENLITMGTTSPVNPADSGPYIYLQADA